MCEGVIELSPLSFRGQGTDSHKELSRPRCPSFLLRSTVLRFADKKVEAHTVLSTLAYSKCSMNIYC